MSLDIGESDVKGMLKHNYPEDNLEVYLVSKDLISPKIDSDVERILKPEAYEELS